MMNSKISLAINVNAIFYYNPQHYLVIEVELYMII